MDLKIPFRKLRWSFFYNRSEAVTNAVTKPFFIHDGDEKTWSYTTVKEFEANAKSYYALLQALNYISIVINYKSAHENCSNLIVTHEGTSQVKRAKIDLIHFQYENFSMNDNETIDDMITRFTKITNELSSLGGPIDND